MLFNARVHLARARGSGRHRYTWNREAWANLGAFVPSFERRRRARACLVRDRYWQAVHRALLPILSPADAVLMPRGDWDAFPCAVRHYDAVIEPGEATVLVLHKGRLPGIRKSSLAAIAAEWGCVYANEVFAVFGRSRRSALEARCGLWRRHLRHVHAYLKAREAKRRESTLYYVHLPKTGGTSFWASLSRAFRSQVYYGDTRTFLANPPKPGEYDLVGVHFSPTLINGVLSRGDEVVGLMREPTARFLSSVAHCRRPTEDPVTFSPSQKAMREMHLSDFLKTEFARYEARAQLIELGRTPDLLAAGPNLPAAGMDDQTLLANALGLLDQDRALIAPSESSDQLAALLERRLEVRLPRLRALNVNDPADYARHADEFAEARPAIEALNASEGRLYAAARMRFEQTARA